MPYRFFISLTNYCLNQFIFVIFSDFFLFRKKTIIICTDVTVILFFIFIFLYEIFRSLIFILFYLFRKYSINV